MRLVSEMLFDEQPASSSASTANSRGAAPDLGNSVVATGFNIGFIA